MPFLKALDEAKEATGVDLSIYGQENDYATRALAKMNMILHDCPAAEIWKDSILSTPHFKQAEGKLKTFDSVVAIPPFSHGALKLVRLQKIVMWSVMYRKRR